jgi:hypothetical protein
MSAEKENVFRALREEELFVTFWGCRIGWHKWTKYREPGADTDGWGRYILVQERRCNSCNKAGRKIISRV